VIWIATTERRAALRHVVQCAVVAFALSSTIEVVQAVSPLRTSSVADVITDTGGALAGAAVMLTLIVLTRRSVRVPSYLGVPSWILAGGYGGAVVAEAIGPLFRQELIGLHGINPMRRLKEAIAAAQLAPTHRNVWLDVALDGILFAPAGALVVMALRELRMSALHAAVLASVAGLVIMIAAEATHGIFGIEMVPFALAGHTAAIGFGAFVAAGAFDAPFDSPASSKRVRLAWIFYCALIVLWATRPFIPRFDYAAALEQLSSPQVIPMLSLTEKPGLYSVSYVIRQSLLFFPAGAMLAIWPLSHRGWLSNILPVVYATILLELTHLFVAGRFFDTTNVALSVAGAGIGWLLMRTAGFRVRWNESST
jgi:glycopeptide antibiotics resistance protein